MRPATGNCVTAQVRGAGDVARAPRAVVRRASAHNRAGSEGAMGGRTLLPRRISIVVHNINGSNRNGLFSKHRYTSALAFLKLAAVPASTSPKHIFPGFMARNKSIAESPVDTRYDFAVSVPLDAEFEARWAAWHARGVAHERAVRRKFLILAPVLAIAAAIVYALLGR